MAASGVLLHHAGAFFPGGFLGVDAFFVLSGYLVGGQVLKASQAGTFDFRLYFARRFRRLVPALVVMVLAVLAAGGWLLLPDEWQALAWSAAWQPTLLANLHFLNGAGYFAPEAATQPLLHTWSLAVEAQAWLLLPLLLHRRLGASPPWRGIALAAVGSLALWCGMAPRFPSAVFYLLPTRLWEFLLGVLALRASAWRIGPRWRAALSWVGLLLLAAGFAMVRPSAMPSLVGSPGVCMGTLLLLVAGNDGRHHGSLRWLAAKPLALVGRASYSLYLWHWPLFAGFRIGWPDAAADPANQWCMVLLALVAGLLSWRFIEEPARRAGWLQARRGIVGAAIASLLLTTAAAVTILAGQGFPERLPARVRDLAAARQDQPPYTELRLADAEASRFLSIGDPASEEVKVMLWGDSHARSLQPVVSGLCRERGWKGMCAAHSGTLPGVDLVSLNEWGLGREAPPWNAAIMAFIERHRIPLVIMAGAWASGAVAAGESDAARFDESLATSVTRLRAVGCRVAIVRQIPSQPWDVPPHLARHRWRTGTELEHGMPLDRYLMQRSMEDRMLAAAGAAGADILDPRWLLYRDAFASACRLQADGRPLFCDAYHVSNAGAEFLRPLFAPLFRTPAGTGARSESGGPVKMDSGK